MVWKGKGRLMDRIGKGEKKREGGKKKRGKMREWRSKGGREMQRKCRNTTILPYHFRPGDRYFASSLIYRPICNLLADTLPETVF